MLGILFFGFFIINKAVNLSAEKKLNPWLPIAIWDISGIQSYENASSLKGYNQKTSDPLVFGESCQYKINLPQGQSYGSSKDEARYFFALWLQKIFQNPRAYIHHRLKVAKAFFGLEGEQIHYPYPAPIFSENKITQKSERSQLNINNYWFYDKNAHGIMYRYWFYIVSSSIILFLIFVFKIHDASLFVLYVSILAAAVRVIILPATDFRYGLWIVIGSIILFYFSIDKILLLIFKKNN